MFPHLVIDGVIYWQVACKKCCKADCYKIFFDNINHKVVFQCQCGNVTEWSKAELVNKPDTKSVPFHHLI